MSLARTLDVMAATLQRAPGVPLSASCMINRAEMLSLVEQARGALPAEIEEASQLLVHRTEMLDQAEREANNLLDEARRRARDLVESSAIVARAHLRAEQILDAARAEAARLLRDADDYCDRRLGEFEQDLDRTLRQVRRGRDRLRERSDLHERAVGPDGAERPDSRAGAPPGPEVVDLTQFEQATESSGLGRDGALQ